MRASVTSDAPVYEARAYWPSISSQWRRSGGNGCTYSSSSSWAAAVRILPDAHPIRARHGSPAGPATGVDVGRAPRTRSLSDSRLGPGIHGRLRRGIPQRGDSDHSDAVLAPRTNGVAGRFARTVRSECLDWLLVLRASAVCPSRVHGSLQRPSSSQGVGSHAAQARRPVVPEWSSARVQRRERLGGVIHEYALAA